MFVFDPPSKTERLRTRIEYLVGLVLLAMAWLLSLARRAADTLLVVEFRLRAQATRLGVPLADNARVRIDTPHKQRQWQKVAQVKDE